MIEQPKQQQQHTTTMPPISPSASPNPHLQTPTSQHLQHLAGCEWDSLECYCGLNPDPKKLISALGIKHSGVTGRSCVVDDPKAFWSEDSKVEATGDSLAFDSYRNSFSHARKDEWQEKKLGSDAFRRRPASIDFNNNPMASSPRNGAVSKGGLIYSHRSGTFPSPGAPNYRYSSSVGLQKGWSSERVPLASYGNRRRVNSTMLPYSYGRTLPSKWEDAERWIFSPVSSDGFVRPGVPNLHRQHKSISGPISVGPPGIAYYSLYSPCIPVPGAAMENRMAGTAFSAGVIATDGSGIHYSGHGQHHSGNREPGMSRSVSVHGCSLDVPETLCEKAHGAEDAATIVSRVVSRRDFATQMSPEGSTQSSPRKRPSTSTLSIVESQSYQSSHSDVKDVEVDERVTVTKWSKKNKARKSRNGVSYNAEDWAKKTIVSQSCALEVSETRKSVARYAREEARIAAWENLQKAKAEAAVRRLEMKLEKKRSSSMDKIMNKLRSAQRRAQDMRSSVLATNQTQHEVAGRTSQNAILPRRGKTRQVRSLSGCFTCHTF